MAALQTSLPRRARLFVGMRSRVQLRGAPASDGRDGCEANLGRFAFGMILQTSSIRFTAKRGAPRGGAYGRDVRRL